MPVQAFALEPLAAVPGLLHVARGRVVDDRVAEHVVERLLLRDVLAAPADDDGQFALPVDLGGNLWVKRDRSEGRVDRVRALGEEHRVFRVLLGRGVGVAQPLTFLEVLGVVPAHRVHVARRVGDRGEQVGVLQGDDVLGPDVRSQVTCLRSGRFLSHDEREHAQVQTVARACYALGVG